MKKMKDRNMENVVVIFKEYYCPTNSIPFQYWYDFDNLEQPSNKITIQYLANLGDGHFQWDWHRNSKGEYVQNLTFKKSQFELFEREVKRLGGKVVVIKS